jgi:hypothetical protein
MPGVPVPDWEPDETGRNVPAKITVADFRRYFLASFPPLAAGEHDGLIQDAIDTVYAMFPGIRTLWDVHAKQLWYDKTVTCYRLLTAWFIMDRYPEVSSAYASVNGMPLKRKKVDGVDLTFETGFLQETPGAAASMQDVLGGLKSNDFGRKALLMIRCSAKRVMLRNSRVT